MTKLYFVRHGKTQWNLEGRYQGAKGDSPLLPESYRQIDLLAAYLHTTRFSVLYTSPLQRAQSTAQYLAKQLDQGLTIKVVDALREFDLGKMEGMLFTEVAKRYPGELNAFRNSPANYNPAHIEGETFSQLIARMKPAIEQIIQADKTGRSNILIVSHGAALVALIQSLIGTPIEDIRKDGGLTNTSLTVLETKDRGDHFKLIKWNETSYLTGTLEASDTI